MPEVLPYWGQLAASADDARSILDGLGASVRGLAGDLNIDGSIGSRTAALRDDYTDAPGERGSLYLSVDEAAAHLAACSVLGIQAGFHIIGDAGLDAALDALDRAAAEVGEQRVRAAGHRFEHVEMADADAIGRLAKHSVTVSVQPGFDAVWGGPGRLYQERLGYRERAMNAFASFYAAGVPICFGSDSPVTPLNPWASVRACLAAQQPGPTDLGAGRVPRPHKGRLARSQIQQSDGGPAGAGSARKLCGLGGGGTHGPGCRRPGAVLEHGSPGPHPPAPGAGHGKRSCLPADCPRWAGAVHKRLPAVIVRKATGAPYAS